MPTRKHYVELTLRAMYDAVNTMTEQVAELHNVARKKRGEEAIAARQYADRIATSVKEIRDTLQALEQRLRIGDAANESPPKRPGA